jgi:hypothetical protein
VTKGVQQRAHISGEQNPYFLQGFGSGEKLFLPILLKQPVDVCRPLEVYVAAFLRCNLGVKDDREEYVGAVLVRVGVGEIQV